MERVIAFSIEHVLVQNALHFHRNFGVPAAFHLRSISRSICVPVTRSLLSYFCPVLYLLCINFWQGILYILEHALVAFLYLYFVKLRITGLIRVHCSLVKVSSLVLVELFVSRGLHVFALLLLLYVSYTVSYTFLVS